MSKQKKGLVPELRFPEFEKEPNWPCVRLNAVAKKSTSKNKGEKITRVLTNSAVDGVVDQRDYFEKDIAVKGNLESYYVVDKGDYVYNPRISSTAPVGPISKNKVGKGVMSPLYTVFRFNSKKNDFFEQFFKSSKWYAYLQTVSNSGARHDRMSITSSDFMAMPVPNPCELEQQKISDCLASIDELITLHTQKLSALRDHKKGLTEKLFPAEGEAVPKLRFPGFIDNWIPKTGREITSKITKGSSPSWQGFSYQKYGVLFITSENVRDGHLDVTCPKYLPEDFYNKQKNSQLQYGDILINIVGASIGRNCLYLCHDKAFTNQAVALFRVDKRNSSEFISYAYQHDRIQSEILGCQSDSARPNLSLTNLRDMVFLIPSLPEQEKIANFLSTIDSCINSQAERVEALRLYKNGLVQKLFPVMDDAV